MSTQEEITSSQLNLQDVVTILHDLTSLFAHEEQDVEALQDIKTIESECKRRYQAKQKELREGIKGCFFGIVNCLLISLLIHFSKLLPPT